MKNRREILIRGIAPTKRAELEKGFIRLNAAYSRTRGTDIKGECFDYSLELSTEDDPFLERIRSLVGGLRGEYQSIFKGGEKYLIAPMLPGDY